MCGIQDNIRELQARKSELKDAKLMIDRNGRESGGLLPLLEEALKEISDEINLLSYNTVSVRLGDLVDELSSLTGISIPNMKIRIETNVRYWGERDLYEMIELMNSEEYKRKLMKNGEFALPCCEVTLFSNKNSNETQAFEYSINFRLDLWNDDKSLLEHCSTNVRFDKETEAYYTSLVINRNIKDLVLDLSLYTLMQDECREDGLCWYPADLFTQAVLNCVKRKQLQHASQNGIKK